MKKKDNQDIDIEKTEEASLQRAKEEEMKEFINSFSSKKGLSKGKELFKWIGTGVFMGSSDAIPGYSGGTTLALIGFFKKLIIVAKSIFIPTHGITRIRAILFLLPFLMGWIVGVFGIAKATESMASHGMGLELIFFFSTFVAFAIPIFLRSIRNKKIIHEKQPKKITKIIFALMGFGLIISLAIVVLLGKGGAPFHGVDEKNKENVFDLSGWFTLAVVAFLAGAVTLIPGGSGAIIQLLSGMYDKIHWTIMANVDKNVFALFIFATSTFMGMVCMIFILSWFLSKHETILEMISLGMLVASPIAILIIPETSLWGHAKEWPHIIGLVASSIAGASLALTINHYTKYRAA